MHTKTKVGLEKNSLFKVIDECGNCEISKAT
jgi:hypothetical protein